MVRMGSHCDNSDQEVTSIHAKHPNYIGMKIKDPIHFVNKQLLNIYCVSGIMLVQFNLVAQFSSIWSLSCILLFETPCTAARQASLSITNSWSLLKLLSILSVVPSNHLILCCALHSCLQSFPPSGSFLMSCFFASGGQTIGVSALASVLPVNIQD